MATDDLWTAMIYPARRLPLMRRQSVRQGWQIAENMGKGARIP